MSLSKYYERSEHFQPEEIVRQDVGVKSPWKPTPLPRSKENRFSPRAMAQGSSPKAPVETTPPSPSAEAEPANIQLPVKNPAPSAARAELPPVEEVDLSKYVEAAVAEHQRAEAYREGLAQGRVEERKRLEEDFAKAARALLLSCQQLDALRETIIANSTGEIIDFTLAIAEKILRFSVHEQDITIVATIEEALRKAVKSEEFSIFLHPDDHAVVAAKAAEIVAGISGLNNIVLRKDKNIERGGAKIESDNCTIDATIAGQFDLILQQVRKSL